MQTKSIIKKTATLTATYYSTRDGILMDNNGEFTLTYGDDGLCGVTSLEAGLKMINWDENTETKLESISWI